jgi:hypothetical protein
MTEPDRIRRDIEGTQRDLSANVDALADKVNPSRIVERRVGRIRTAVASAKDKVMGTAANATSAVGDKVGSTASATAGQARSAASTADDAVTNAPEALRRGTQGNPIAAGLIAFGAGWLVSSLLPPSKAEQDAAGRAVEFAREHAKPVARQVTQEFTETMREPAQEAAESVRSAAGDAVSALSDRTRSAAEDVADRVQEAKQHVQSDSSH